MIVSALEIVSLAISCAILVWGFKRLIEIVQSAKDDIVNQAMIFWHIVAYFFFYIADIVKTFLLERNKIQEEVSTDGV